MVHSPISKRNTFCLCLHNSSEYEVDAKCYWPLCHDLIEMMLCDRQSKICMIHWCKNCPGIEPVEKFLYHYIGPQMYRIQRIMRTVMILMKLRLILNNGQKQMKPIWHQWNFHLVNSLQGLNQITWHILKKKLGLMRPLFRKTLLKTIHS